MQRICRLICKICRICKKICKKICRKYDIKYATNMQNMQKNMQNMSDHKTLQVYPKICKICNKYAKYVSQNLICRICTPHFADDEYFTVNKEKYACKICNTKHTRKSRDTGTAAVT